MYRRKASNNKIKVRKPALTNETNYFQNAATETNLAFGISRVRRLRQQAKRESKELIRTVTEHLNRLKIA